MRFRWLFSRSSRPSASSPAVVAFAALVGVVAAGCSTSSAVTLAPVGTSPAGSFSSGLASVPAGVVLGFKVTNASAQAVTATSDDPTIALVAPATQQGEFVIVGVAAGTTTLRVYANDQQAESLPIVVGPSAP
jgi:hypothetical protein